jgi:hypothetical protein
VSNTPRPRKPAAKKTATKKTTPAAKKATPAVVQEDVHALLADPTAGPPERTVRLCLRANLQSEWEELTGRLERLHAKDAVTMAGRGRHAREREQLAAQIADLEAQMEAATVPFRVRANRRRYNELRLEHPPRKGEDGKPIDEDAMGVNVETFFEPLIRAMLVEPVLSPEQFEALMDRLSDGQLDSLWQAAWFVNRGKADVPFSRAASKTIHNSESE